MRESVCVSARSSAGCLYNSAGIIAWRMPALQRDHVSDSVATQSIYIISVFLGGTGTDRADHPFRLKYIPQTDVKTKHLTTWLILYTNISWQHRRPRRSPAYPGSFVWCNCPPPCPACARRFHVECCYQLWGDVVVSGDSYIPGIYLCIYTNYLYRMLHKWVQLSTKYMRHQII